MLLVQFRVPLEVKEPKGLKGLKDLQPLLLELRVHKERKDSREPPAQLVVPKVLKVLKDPKVHKALLVQTT